MIKRHFFLGLSFLCSLGTNAATLFVESLDDTVGGTVLTLRQALMDASSGDTIQFDVTGTIVLDEFLGELVVDKQLTIDGQNKIIVDGKDQINICFHITNAGADDASNTIIQNITIQNFSGSAVDPGSGTALQELPAYGILIDGGPEGCSIFNTTIKNIRSGLNQEVAGIRSSEEVDALENNSIHSISSADNVGSNSGKTYGVFVDNTVLGNCSDNLVYDIQSGSAGASSGGFQGIAGIFIDGTLEGDCLSNTVYNVRSGTAGTSSGNVAGISFSGTGTNECSFNTVYNLSTGSAGDISGLIFGISTSSVNNMTHNTIHHFTTGVANNNTGQATGIILSLINGDLSHNLVHDVDSGLSNRDSGALFGIVVSVNIIGSCSENTLYNIASGDANRDSGRIFGLRLRPIGLNFEGNSVANLSSGKAGEDSGAVFAVDGGSVGNRICKNSVRNLSSGSAGSQSGDVFGIEMSDVDGDCFDNTVQQLTVGDAPNAAGFDLLGICFDEMNANFYNNVVSDLVVSGSSLTGQAGGVFLSFVASNVFLACNGVRDVTGNQDGLTFGIHIEEGNNFTIRNNSLDDIENINGPAHGLILGNSSDEGKRVTNSFVSFNTISSITGSSANGFGITILGPQDQSVGNDLLNNSIFNINGKSINIIDNGVPVDAVVALQSAVCSSTKIFIRGTVQPEPGFENSEFLVQFFTSNSNIPPQTMTFLGEETVANIGSGSEIIIPFLAEIKGCFPQTSGQFITATATAQPSGTEQNNNTSEVSNAIAGCNTSGICSFVCTPAPVPPACPIR